MSLFKREVLNLFEEGQKPGVADKWIVNKVVGEFVENYKAVTGEAPKPVPGLLDLCVTGLEAYGYKFPGIEDFREECLISIRSTLERIKGFSPDAVIVGGSEGWDSE